MVTDLAAVVTDSAAVAVVAAKATVVAAAAKPVPKQKTYSSGEGGAYPASHFVLVGSSLSSSVSIILTL